MNLEQKIAQYKTYYVDKNLTEANFPAPKVIETENPQLIYLDENTSSEECLKMIKEKGLRPANVHELVEYAKHAPKGKHYVAFGSEITLGGFHRVPHVYAYTDGDFEFSLGYFGGGWYDYGVLLAFCDKQNSDTLTLGKELEPLSLETAIKICKENGLTVTKTY